MDEAKVLCDRVAIMDHAKIVALDTTEQLLIKTGADSRMEFTACTALAGETFRTLPGVVAMEQEEPDLLPGHVRLAGHARRALRPGTLRRHEDALDSTSAGRRSKTCSSNDRPPTPRAP